MLHAAGVLAADAPLDVSKMLLRARPATRRTARGRLSCRDRPARGRRPPRQQGYAKTILNAGSAPVAIAVKNGGRNRIEDLAVHTQGSTAVLVESAQDVTVSRVAIRGGAVGVQLQGVQGGRVRT